MQPFAGIRILDLTRLLPGGFATMMLADMGADVMKVESPDGGDYARWTPPMISGQGAYFHAINRGKRSIIINLKNTLGVDVLKRLVTETDVLIESFRPGVMARLDCDYEALKSVNPRLIYCALSGWGQDGVYADRSGHDLNFVSTIGLTGEMSTPQPLGGQIADMGGAYAAVAAISAALFGRQRTDEGAFIDCSLFDAAVPFFTTTWVEAVAAQADAAPSDAPQGRLTGKYANYNIYQTRDGKHVALAALELKFWENFCRAIERPDLIPYHDQPNRQHYLIIELGSIFSMKTADEWSALLDSADCCFSQVNTAAQTADHPQIKARGLLGVGDNGIPWLRSPIRFAGTAPTIGVAPGYGAHTHAILREAGYTDAEIDILVKSEAVQG